jgi:DEAD/DEAH box helicase
VLLLVAQTTSTVTAASAAAADILLLLLSPLLPLQYDDIPVETSGENVPEPIDTFPPDILGPELMHATNLCGYAKPTPVQKYSIPIGISGRDLMACAQTGSGKTAGFLFPTLISLLRSGGPQVSIALLLSVVCSCRSVYLTFACMHSAPAVAVVGSCSSRSSAAVNMLIPVLYTP